MKNTLYTILVLLFGITSLQAQHDKDPLLDYQNPKEYEIGGLTVTGLQYLDHNIVTSLSGLYIGKKIEIPGDATSEAIKKLWKQNLFGSIGIEATQTIGNKVFLEIKVKELPRLTGFYFTGLKKGEQEDVKAKLGLIRGRVLTEGMKSDVKNQVINFLIDKGFKNADCNLLEMPDSTMNNGVLLALDADRGERTRIDQINFYGNYDITDRKLKRMMQETKEATKFSFVPNKEEREANKKVRREYSFKERIENLSLSSILDMIDKRARFRIFSSSKFIKKDYVKDRNGLLQAFYDSGYRDASIESDSLYNIDENKMRIDININQGKKYYFRNINFVGNTKYSADTLKKVVGIRKGDVYNSTLLTSRLNMDASGTDLSSLYMDDGYLFFNLNTEETIVNEDSIDIMVSLYEGTQATIDKIMISGNAKTKEDIIRRELSTKPGNKFSRSDIIRSNRDLAALGFFDPAKIEILPQPHPEKGTVDIEYKVEEKSGDQLNLSAGYGGKDPNTSKERINIQLGVVFNNFSLKDMFKKGGWKPIPAGDGERLSININTTGAYYQAFQLGYTKPWFGGRRPNTFSFNSYTGFSSNGLAKGTATYWHFINNSISAGLGWRLKKPDDFFNFYMGASLRNYNLKNYPQLLAGSSIATGKFTNPSFTFELSRNNVDGGGIFPTRGTQFNLSFNPSLPLSLMPWNRDRDYASESIETKFRWLEYHKTRFNFAMYTPLKNTKFVLKSSIKTGFIGYFNKDYGQTPFDLFELGDVTNFQGSYGFQGRDYILLRGYEGSVTDVKWNGTGWENNTGFEIFNKFTMELRYPFSSNPNSQIFGLAFFEAGNGWHTMKDYNPLQLKRSAGLGVRFFLPMFGLIGIDYGIRFDKSSVNDATIKRNLKWTDYIQNYGKITFMLGFEPE